MILAPATMAAEKDPKEAARKCLEEIGLDPDGYRVGHTKARVEPLCRNFTNLVYCYFVKVFVIVLCCPVISKPYVIINLYTAI